MRNSGLNIDNICNLRGCTDYRLGDIFFRTGSTQNWYDSANIVKSDKKYINTIGQDYLLNQKIYLDNFCMSDIINKYSKLYNITYRNNELILHLRVGDTIFDPWYLTGNYIRKIKQQLHKDITDITVVAVFSWADIPNKFEWAYSEELLLQNKICLQSVFNTLEKEFKNNYNLFTLSTTNVDYDLLYCVSSNIFIEDTYRSSFNKLIQYLRLNCYDRRFK